MARSLSKVQKQISKKRGGKPNALHENSRDAQRLRRAGAREDKIARLVDAAHKANQIYVDRVAWFREALEGSNGTLSESEIRALTDSDELAEIKAQRRPGRPPSKSEEQLQSQLDAENREYRAGYWVPDLQDEEGRFKLEKWSGDWAGLNSLKFIRIVKDGAIRPSSFPPKVLWVFSTTPTTRCEHEGQTRICRAEEIPPMEDF